MKELSWQELCFAPCEHIDCDYICGCDVVEAYLDSMLDEFIEACLEYEPEVIGLRTYDPHTKTYYCYDQHGKWLGERKR
ncbi:MAG: hypothetical protein WC208_16105 [Gallionella sp.]|jgi:hypothetical protein